MRCNHCCCKHHHNTRNNTHRGHHSAQRPPHHGRGTAPDKPLIRGQHAPGPRGHSTRRAGGLHVYYGQTTASHRRSAQHSRRVRGHGDSAAQRRGPHAGAARPVRFAAGWFDSRGVQPRPGWHDCAWLRFCAPHHQRLASAAFRRPRHHHHHPKSGRAIVEQACSASAVCPDDRTLPHPTRRSPGNPTPGVGRGSGGVRRRERCMWWPRHLQRCHGPV